MDRSKLVKMKVTNFGCIGSEGLEIALDNIVCLVGSNNAGKSTVLKAYESAVTMAALSPGDVNVQASKEGQPATVELWVHIPEGAENVGEKWKEKSGDLLLVRSKWEWGPQGGKAERKSWDPEARAYSDEDKTSGLDAVFGSRLPRPFKIGSLEAPGFEHKKLLELVLEPIARELNGLMKNQESELWAKVRALQEEASKPVVAFKEDLARVQDRVNTSYRRVFSSAQVQLTVELGELKLDPVSALSNSSRVEVVESQGQTSWDRQGTGSQRALFWSMLEVRSELNRLQEERKQAEKLFKDRQNELKKAQAKLPSLKAGGDAARRVEEQIERLMKEIQEGVPEPSGADSSFLPGYMLLIDEPETALHPSAVRAAKDHLYSLADNNGWQVMLSTHHPAFVDPVKDHTTIVRLHRPEAHATPNTYRADEMEFTPDERENLKSLLAFDLSVAEMFFGSRPIVVEGDTESAVFSAAMEESNETIGSTEPSLVLRARGKWIIPLLIRMLAHFRVPFAVLHDIDSPFTKPSKNKAPRANPAYAANAKIEEEVAKARAMGVPAIHRTSCPDFERECGIVLSSDKDKPFQGWRAVRECPEVKGRVLSLLKDLARVPTSNASEEPLDGRHFERRLKDWALANAPDDPAFGTPMMEQASADLQVSPPRQED